MDLRLAYGNIERSPGSPGVLILFPILVSLSCNVKSIADGQI